MTTELQGLREESAGEPVLRVIRGRPSDSELAAVVGAVLALPREEEPDENGGRRRRAASWADPGLRLRVRRSWRDTSVPARRGMDR
ncbi:acyl-CoA carboxylase subunit epsilon [Glycomyces xiaoerkulensis]|uniref:acyl-CoA carboxylase subunit epsilon n=1 Tax=Glycomyces xiaoerkulensis TaxID=2038139 RepID=UPI0012FFFFFD|nr:acyl-CoA carboxylase subunit epsilon [Glycomyces xiaoerkulensis]